jgi:MoxR-like ATPase
MSIDSPAETLSEKEVIAEAEQALDGIKAMRSEIGKVIFGQEQVVENAIVAILSGGHALLVGVPGLAKTKLVDTLGTVLGISAGRIQFTPDLMPSDILGSEVLEQSEDGKRSFRFVKGPIFTQLLMADEINRASPRTQSALLQAMQEYHVTFGGERHDLPAPFHVLATQNPLEQEGTYPLPEAQLDRFLLQIDVDYPSLDAERQILLETTGTRDQHASPVFTSDKLMTCRSWCAACRCPKASSTRSSNSCAPPVPAPATRPPTPMSPGAPARAPARR